MKLIGNCSFILLIAMIYLAFISGISDPLKWNTLTKICWIAGSISIGYGITKTEKP